MNINLYFCVFSFLYVPPFTSGLFEGCNHDILLKQDDKIYINSPYYPAQYPIGTSCRYTVRAPADQKLQFKCDIDMNVSPAASRCSNEIFYFNREGSELLTGSEYFCGSGTMERKSLFNRAVISYISTPNYRRNIPKAGAGAGGGVSGGTVGITAIEENTETIEQQAAIDDVGSYVPPSHHGDTFNLDISMLLKEDKTEDDESLYTTIMQDVHKDEQLLSTAFERVVAMLSNTSAGIITATTKRTKNKTTTTTTRSTTVKATTKFKTKRRKTSTTTTTTTTETPTKIVSKTTQKSSADPIIAVNKTFVPLITGIVDHHMYIPSDSDWSNYLTSSTANTLTALPSHLFIKSPKIVNDGGNFISTGGGSFSCLVEVVDSDCDCGRNGANYTQFGSQEAALNEFPSMAGVMTVRSRRIFCGAAIIHNRFLLSAAHCFNTSATNSAVLLLVVVGEHDLTTVFESLYTRYYNIDSIILHENFRPSSRGVRNDIALLRTSTYMEWNRGVSPVCLPFKGITDVSGTSRRPPIPGQRLQVAGWGTLSFGGPQSTVLRKVTLDVIASESCKQLLRSLPMYTFCTYTPGFDTCQYDSGGALFLRRAERLYAVGIVSYGFACAQNRLPSVNTKVSAFVKWIKDKSGANFCEM